MLQVYCQRYGPPCSEGFPFIDGEDRKGLGGSCQYQHWPWLNMWREDIFYEVLFYLPSSLILHPLPQGPRACSWGTHFHIWPPLTNSENIFILLSPSLSVSFLLIPTNTQLQFFNLTKTYNPMSLPPILPHPTHDVTSLRNQVRIQSSSLQSFLLYITSTPLHLLLFVTLCHNNSG